MNKLLTKENKDVACEKVMVHVALMNRKMEMDDIRRGGGDHTTSIDNGKE